MSTTSKFLIAATSSGSGKTTLTLGLLRALRNRGKKVQAFKCGPDYIDTKFHCLAADCPSINLDLFLSSPQHVEQQYLKYSSNADVAITEGVMGLFDGYDKMEGSAAQIAELTNQPILLVINAKSTAYSTAAMLYGFKNFYKGIKVLGAVFNFVASESHYSFLKDACLDVGIEPLGYLPKNAEIEVPSRHLGLNTDSNFQLDSYFESLAALVEKHIDLDKLSIISCIQNVTLEQKTNLPQGNMKIAVARDEAFNFMYHENIKALEQWGEVTYFSPIHDKELPKADFVYLPGGYPELHLEALSSNGTMLASIKEYAKQGGKMLAECGGMMYLSSSIIDADGTKYPMVGIFGQDSTMQSARLKLGYRYFKHKDVTYKGHEFHYSSLLSDLPSIVQQYGAKNQEVDTKLLRYKNVLAGYTHLYWAETNNLKDLFE